MKKIREWIIRKLGGYPLPLPEPKVELKIERIQMETRKIYASVEYLDFHSPPIETLEIRATDELARELYKSGLVHFDYKKPDRDEEYNWHGDKRMIVASVNVAVKKEAS